jgi:uncharacterized protein
MMPDWVQMALALLIGLCGWWIASRLGVPAPSILGPMIVVAIVSCALFPFPDFPSWIKVLVQSVIGGYLGLKIDRETLASTKAMLVPIASSTAWFIFSTLVIGYVVARTTTIDLYSAFLGTTPGGVAEMTAVAVSVRADVALVATLQTVRLITNNVVVPFLARRGAGRRPLTQTQSTPIPASANDPAGFHWLICLLAGAGGGYLLDGLHVPAGGVLGAMIAVAAVRLANVRMKPVPLFMRNLAQVGLGVFVGITFNQGTLIEMRDAFAVVVVATLATIASSLILAWFVQRWLRVDAQTAMLACAPGGLTLMPAIADELGAQTFVVSLFQLARIVCVLLVMPIIFQFLV